MKKIFTFIFVLSFCFGMNFESNAQFVDVGTATGTNGTTTASPINIWFRSLHYQVIYTAAELSLAGATPGGIITGLGWDVTGAPVNNLPNYAIKMKHTAATSTATYDGAGLSTQLTLASYAPAAGGYDVQTFTNNFIWNGTDNILVDICFDQTTGFNASGQVSTFTGNGNYVRSDNSSQCGASTSSFNTSSRPIVRFAMTPGSTITCPQPTSVAVNNVLATSADISWTSSGAPAWIIEYGITGSFTPGSNQNGFITVNNPDSITGLTPVTDYTVCVREFCAVGDTSFPTCQTFSTPCVSYPAPYLENFDASLSVPTCWTNTNLSSDTWRFNASGGFGPAYGVAGAVDHTSGAGNYTWIDASGNINANELISPDIDFSSLTQGIVGCWIYSNNIDDGAQNTLEIDAWDGSAWVNILTYGGNVDGWNRIYGLIPASIPTTTRFRMVQVGSTTGTGSQFFNDLLIDDFFVDEAPTCLEPTNINVTVLNSSSAEISWTTGGASAWQIEYGEAPFAQGNGTLVSVSTNPFILTGLTDNTEYFFYIQDSCSTTDVSWWAGGSLFETPCITYNAPWLYNVETAAAATNGLVEDCWSSNPAGPTFNYRWNTWETGQFTSTGTGPLNAFSGDKYFYTEASSGGVGSVAELVTPFVDVSTLTTGALMFQYHFFGTQIDRMYIDIFDGTVWIDGVDSIVGQQQFSETDDWIFHTTDISSYTGVIQARFRGIRGSGFSGDMSIDDIRFDNVPTCFNPTQLMDSVIDPFTVELSWTTGGASDWIVEYGLSGFTPGTGTSVGTSTNPTIISGLIPGQDYDWYVQDSCSATDVSWQSTASSFRLPAVIFCDSSSINFTYCHPDESIESFRYQSENGTSQLHFVFNSGITGAFVDFTIYDGPDDTYPILFTSTGNANMAGVEFTSNSSIVTFDWNSQFANPCNTDIDFDVNCCEATSSNQTVYVCVDSTTILANNDTVGKGAYNIVIPNVRGCDSLIAYLVLELEDTTNINDNLCTGETYTFADGTTTTMPGTYQVTVANQNGCDSTINYNITSISPSSSSISAFICPGEFYTLPDGVSVNTAGSYTATLTNEVGCDSVITVVLSVYSNTFSIQSVNVCEGDFYELPDGLIVTTSGSYTSNITNVNGCDSVVTTNLTITQVPYSQTVVEICGDETVTLANGDEVSQSGEYNVSVVSASGCDSLVTVLVSKCNSIEGLTDEEILSVYPNPASNYVSIELNNTLVNEVDFRIVDAMGKTVYAQAKVDRSAFDINLNNFASGMYFIVVSNVESSSIHKFVIAK